MTVALRGGIQIDNPLDVALGFFGAYSSREDAGPSGSFSFDESDLRFANRGGARISAAEIDAVLHRRRAIERALRSIDPAASLAGASAVVPWGPLTRLFHAFATIRGFGYSKMTKALYRKRPALIPILDSVVRAYLTGGVRTKSSSESFGEEAAALVRSYKHDLDDNLPALHEIQQQLANHGYRVTEVRLLDVLIWSEFAGR